MYTVHCTALCPGLLRWASTRKVKPIWILLEQETVSGSGISWAICKSAPCSRQITMPAPHHSVFYRPDALPAAQPTASKHWRHTRTRKIHLKMHKQQGLRKRLNSPESSQIQEKQRKCKNISSVAWYSLVLIFMYFPVAALDDNVVRLIERAS